MMTRLTLVVLPFAALFLSPNALAVADYAQTSSALVYLRFIHAPATSESVSMLVKKQVLDPSCESCNDLVADQALCTNDEDYSCLCHTQTIQDYIGCSICDESMYAGYSGGLKGVVDDALDECDALGIHVSGIDTSSLPTDDSDPSAVSTRVTTASSSTTSSFSRITSTVGSGSSSSSAPDCASICDSVCVMRSGRLKRQDNDSMMDCMCTQAYFDSQYSCFACGSVLLGNDDLQKEGVDSLKTFQQTCAEAGYSGITTQDGLATFNPSSTSFGSAATTAGSRTTTSARASSGASASSGSDSEDNQDGSGGAAASNKLAAGLLAFVICCTSTVLVL